MNLPEPQSKSYSTLLAQIDDGRVKIPQFQREFVWSLAQSARLIDSILRGYPIGTFILWHTKERLRAVRNIGGYLLPDTPKGDYADLVLDGQQRLTSLFATVRSAIVERAEAGGTIPATDDFADVRVDLEAGEDDPLVVVGHGDRPAGSTLPVSVKLNLGIMDMPSIPEKYRARINLYTKQINSYQFSVVLVHDAPIERATEIFTRLNVGGKALSTFEIMGAKTFVDGKFDLAERTGALKAELAKVEFETLPDAVLLQVFSVLLKKDCSKKTILGLQRKAFVDAWPDAAESIRAAVDHLKAAIGVPASRLLPYPALLVPFAYYFHNHPNAPSAEAAGRLQDLFWRVSLGGHYSTALESRIAQDVKRVDAVLAGRAATYDYPAHVSGDFLLHNGDFNTSKAFVKAVLCLLSRQGPRRFGSDAKVVVDNDYLKQANSKNYHHFFPKAHLAKTGRGERANHVGNITIVGAHDNVARYKAKPPREYLKAEGGKGDAGLAKRLKTHLIEVDADGVWDDDYGRFLRRRCDRIGARLDRLLIPQPSDRADPSPPVDGGADGES